MDMPSLHDRGVTVLCTVVGLICQTFVFGAFAAVMPLSCYIIRKHGTRTVGNWLRYCMWFMFFTSAAYWASCVASACIILHAFFIQPSAPVASATIVYSTVPNSMILINYAVTDGIVVWRAWVLCRRDSGRLLYIPLALWCLACLSMAATLAMRLAITIVRVHNDYKMEPAQLTIGINIPQVSSFALTLLTNIISTALIARKAWKHRREVRQYIADAAGRGHKAESVLALIIESGIFYCLSNVVMVVSLGLRLPYGTVADIYAPVNVQLAGMYPTVVLMIVSMRMTMEESTSDTTKLADTQRPPTPASLPVATSPGSNTRENEGFAV
ncbi:hypothetical protein AURDEDRAFT_173841 [Auricularia subglabra TFB-10046 SS5]|uniref:Fungal pheromone STE3G-protein-coupled receptor n=1 Tax=Auricularia subglabra (strain TFB-10046 / SS5) TaxID=717982 RepID=J0DAB6_AURST|nr:hypothetical protein AURDEDRAFT_173841 [Auricularia subglabra TFB-10046 SS5]